MILEHLRYVMQVVDKMSNDLNNLKFSMSRLEGVQQSKQVHQEQQNQQNNQAEVIEQTKK
jgi:hypothetical protein